MENVIEISGLLKTFNNKNILAGIDLNLEKGSVLGILGPNGQGKSTLIKILAGLVKADFGSVKIKGIPVGFETKKKVSFMPETPVLPKWMKINDAIEFYKSFYDDFNEKIMEEYLTFMQLNRGLAIKTLSKGMLEKLMLSLTLSRQTDIYILDEPISGVDTVTREKIIKSIIKELDGEKSMIITSHYLNEAEQILDKAVFIKDGVIAEYGNIDDLKVKYNDSLEGVYRKIYEKYN